MSLDLDKSAWRRVALRDVVHHVTDRVDPRTSGLERFLAGEHIPSNDLAISSWGDIGKDPIGPMFYKRFRPGHVLYVSRRTYLRKVAVPDFEGITGEKTFVLETNDSSVLLQEFLPFILSAERFHAYAIANSRGSVNPYLNWGELADYEFDIPPLEQQTRLADLLWAIERHLQRAVGRYSAMEDVREALLAEHFEGAQASSPSLQLGDTIVLEYGKSLPERDRSGDGYPVYGSSGIVGRHRDALVSGPGIIVGRKGTAGSIAYEEDDFFPIDTVYYVRQVSGAWEIRYLALLLEWLRLPLMRAHTAVPGLNRDQVHARSAPLVPLPAQTAFMNVVDSLDVALTKIDQEIGEAKSLLTSVLDVVFRGN